ncbi:MAG: methionine adenosyltransferase, partial [Gammaproteobacteria bacterium]|nr:methionine adenosyltransferase [Gammaproteobacteria bacterium]
MKYIFTSEAVTEGHPDKVADRIADSILDEILKQDPNARVACEVTDAENLVFIFGEITTKAKVDYEKVARDTVKEIGYDKDEYGFNYKTMKVVVKLNTQSPDIALGVDEKDDKDLGAGDQGIMFGFASNETKELMPLPISLAQKLALKLTEVRKNNTLSYLRPDGKTQVSVEYDNDKAIRIDTIVISAQHDEDVSLDTLKKDIRKYVIDEVIDKSLIDSNTKFYINPTGKFVIGGPKGDTGLTGRKIIVDTYGGYAHHGGGSFSGKDPTKVDRSASYALRYAAKNLVASGLCDKCEIELSYAIGVSKPVSIYVNSFNTSKVGDERLSEIVSKVFDFRPSNIIKKLGLRSPIYKNVSVYGHFGRCELDLPWERLDKV